MQKMKEIVISRCRPVYYEDCPKGARLQVTGMSLEHKLRDLWEDSRVPDSDIWDELGELLPVRDFRILCRQQRGRRLGAARAQLTEMIIDLNLKRQIAREAKNLGCSLFGECILCPDGQDLLVRELWDYATDGT